MDFSKLDLRKAEDEEHWIHLRLGDNLLFMDDKKREGPCRVKTASIANIDAKNALKAVTRLAGEMQLVSQKLADESNTANRDRIKKRLDALDIEAEESFSRFLSVAVKDWENIQQDGKPLEFSTEVLADLSKPNAPLFRMASEIAADMAKAQDVFTNAAGA